MCICVCAYACVCARVCVCVFMCKLHSHCLVASACLDQLSVWYLYGSNFSRRILVMVLCSPIRTHARNVCLCVRHLASRKHCVEVNPSALQYIELCCCVCFPQSASSSQTQRHTFVLIVCLRMSRSKQHLKTLSFRTVCRAVWSRTTLWCLFGSKLRWCWLWKQCFINLFLAVSAISCLNMNGMIGTSHAGSKRVPFFHCAPFSLLIPFPVIYTPHPFHKSKSRLGFNDGPSWSLCWTSVTAGVLCKTHSL